MIIYILLLVAISLVQAQPPPPICPFSEGGFHLINAEVTCANATIACQQNGWQLAVLTDLNSPFAMSTLLGCQNQFAWIAAFNGLSRDPCAYITGEGLVWFSTLQNSAAFRQSVLCQEIPIVSEEITVRTTGTLTSGTLSLTTTVTRHPTRLPCEKDAMNQEEQISNCKPSCKDCDIVLDVPRSNLRIIREQTSYDRAAAACAKYGWTLADVFAGQYPTIFNGSQLFGQSNFWIRSFEGVSGGVCVAATVDEQVLGIAYGLTGQACRRIRLAFPLCQCGKPVPTGFGPITGAITTVTTTVTTETVYVSTVPQTTTVATITVCQDCPRSPHGGHHHRRPRH